MSWFARRNVTRIAAPYGAVPRSTTSLMDQRGWKRLRAGIFAGPYATRYGTWHGQIEHAGDTFRVLILSPPTCIQKHARWVCFHKYGDNGWYRIHLAVNPVDRDPNAVIRYVEQIITESFKL
jgi:hypothetical protein